MEKVYILKKENLGSWLRSMIDDNEVFAPAQDRENSIVGFFSLNKLGEDLDWEQDENKPYGLNLVEKTRMSPKEIIYPQTEDLFDFNYQKNMEQLDDVNIEIKSPQVNDKRVIFGLKPCDVEGIARLDKVFIEGVVNDEYYQNRRENTVLIAKGCDTVFTDCFCTMVGGNPYQFDNADIGVMEHEDQYILLVLTQKGRKLTEQYQKGLEPAPQELEYYNKLQEEKIDQSSPQIPTLWEGVDYKAIPEIMTSNFNSDAWKDITRKCIGCGACTFVCPTCYCFDIRDEKDNQQGQRYRCWDFCTSYLYTLEASGHNPRAELSQRYRNKINCKYNYNYQRQGQLYCVGCGRCIEVCPVNMDIREIVDTIIKIKPTK